MRSDPVRGVRGERDPDAPRRYREDLERRRREIAALQTLSSRMGKGYDGTQEEPVATVTTYGPTLRTETISRSDLAPGALTDVRVEARTVWDDSAPGDTAVVLEGYHLSQPAARFSLRPEHAERIAVALMDAATEARRRNTRDGR